MDKLPPSFYRREDVVQISRELIGKVLCTKSNGEELTSGVITETEAYCGRNDKACHANDGKRTRRTEVMYQSGGHAYIYLCYGIHHLFNVVTNKKNYADAVLIRAVKPVDGTDLMLSRRRQEKVTPKLTAGPGRLSEALGILTDYSGISLCGEKIWIEDRSITIEPKDIQTTKRVGVEYAGADADKPWRFILKDTPWIS